MGRLNDISLATQVAVFGNRQAFDRLMRQYQSPVRRFLLMQTMGNEALSDDLAQETFLKAYTHIGQYRGTSSLLTWLTRIAYNVWYDYKRKAETHPQPLPVGKGVDTSAGDTERLSGNNSPHNRVGEGLVGLEGVGLDIYRALSQLRPEDRSCVTLQLVEGYSIGEIAGIMQLPANTVKSHLKRGKEKLANYLRQNGYDR